MARSAKRRAMRKPTTRTAAAGRRRRRPPMPWLVLAAIGVGAVLLRGRLARADAHDVALALAALSGAALATLLSLACARRLRARAKGADARLDALLRASTDAIVGSDRVGTIRTWNRAAEQLFGLSADGAVGRDAALLVPPELGEADAARRRRVLAGAASSQLETVRLGVDGRRIAVASTMFALGSGIGEVVRDITLSKGAQDALHLAHERLALALEVSQLSLWDYDVGAGRVQFDAHWQAMTGDEAGARPVAEIAQRVHADDAAALRAAMAAALRSDAATFQAEFRYRAAAGDWRWLRSTGRVVERDVRGRALRAIGTHLDISARKADEERLHHAAFHDQLTALPNRHALFEHLPRAIARARRSGRPLALGMIDLDDFKPVNDTWGHGAGDRLLQQLTARLQANLRAADYLARLGGDEFVVVVEDLDAQQPLLQLEAALSRLHEAVETAFDLGDGVHTEIGMAAGVALYPVDAQDSDALLRQADAAMYLAKQHKHDRQRWWRLGAASTDWQPQGEPPFDPWGDDAAALLGKAVGLLRAAVDDHVARFYDADEPGAGDRAALFARLAPDEFATLRQRHTAFLVALFEPARDAATIAADAAALGRVHGLVGVDAPQLVHASELLRKRLSEHLNAAPMPARERYRLLLAADSRLQTQLQAQLDAAAQVHADYLGVLAAPLPAPGSLWIDALAAELERLGSLPGVLAALLMRLGPRGVFAVEGAAGPHSGTIGEVLQRPGLEAVVDPGSPRGQGLSALAWRSGEICSSAAYQRDPRYLQWRGRAGEIGLRSAASVPVRGRGGQVVAVVSLFGAWPGQFESPAMQQFARGVQQRWEQVWARCSTPAPAIAAQQAAALRERLFAGGMQMHLQPVVDLRDGTVHKVEALARLQLADGRVLPPGAFLAVLGDADLDHVFRLGLDLALQHRQRLLGDGHAVDVSVNLAPATLLDPDCARWVEEALRRHAVAPQHLSLELLESDGIDSAAQDEAIDQLVRLGVKLVMDDLGSGYSSLRRLSALPFDAIKIDQSLTLNLRRAPLMSLPLIRAIVQLGADLDRHVVVEGLEDLGMIEAALALGATQGQGHALAPPLAPEGFVDWLRGYAPPVRPGRVDTFLGALAHHWMQLQTRQPGAAPTASAVGAFLAARGLREAADWHADGSAQAGQRLLAWLVERVVAEGSVRVT